MVVSAAGGDDDVRVRFRLGEGRKKWYGRRGSGIQRSVWVIGGGGPVLQRSQSAALPHFYCLIYTPSDHVGSSLVEICGNKRRGMSSQE